jgi:hypothetical protein
MQGIAAGKEIPWRLIRVSLRSAMIRSAISVVNGNPELSRQVLLL